MIGLSQKQHQCLEFIRVYQAQSGGISPSYDEIAVAVGYRAKSAVSRVIDQLAAKGRLRRLNGRIRSVELIDQRCLHCGHIIGSAECAAAARLENTLTRVA